MKTISIIDCAVKSASHNCFNRLTTEFNRPFLFHNPAIFSTESLKRVRPDGHIIFGSYSNVHEKLEWQVELAQMMKEEILKGIPVLGICFGHQLMVDVFGGKVGPINMEMDLYQGSREVTILEDKFGFKKGSKKEIFISHRFEVKEIPEDFILLATSKNCKYDGVAHKSLPFFSFQGHPEASEHFVNVTIKKKPLPEKEKLAYRDGLDIIANFLDLVDSL
jgi:GMP synthase (glutamine-hydrolysing)